MRFKPHYNNALGKFYYTKDEYLSDMKKGGYVPYKESDTKEIKRQPYTLSEWGKDMINTYMNANGNVGEKWHRELEKKGQSIRYKRDIDYLPSAYNGKGGFEQGDNQ